MCGGTGLLCALALLRLGLSPRVRGNPKPGNTLGAGARSIPACAGEP